MKALATNYKPVLIEFKNVILFLRYGIFCKKFPIQMYGPMDSKLFVGNLKNH